MRGIVKAILLVPLVLVAVAFSVGNRADVSISFDPFAAGAADYRIAAPLFVVVFASMICGVLLGGIATWVGQGRHRRAERMHRRDVERLRNDIDRLQSSGSVPASR
jgi:uncharacterized membrane protein YciS (DUF1049 family)